MQSILIVDDDFMLRKLLVKVLSPHGFSVEVARDWDEMQKHRSKRIFDLYILDINLPGLSGFEICNLLRQENDQTPIVMLTAKGEENDRIHGLEAGADDYLPKPFNSQELLARIKAVLRRHAYIPFKAVNQMESFSIGDNTYDHKLNALSRHGERIPLTAHELAVLKLLYLQRGRPISQSLIYQHLNGVDYQPNQRAIDLLVSKLRKSLEDLGPDFSLIQTVRGKGYMLVDHDAP